MDNSKTKSIQKTLLWFIAIPIGGFLVAVGLAFLSFELSKEENFLSKVAYGIAAMSLLYLAIGVYHTVRALYEFYNLSKTKRIIVSALLIITFCVCAYYIDKSGVLNF
jgi:hypothetical protein